MAPGYVIKNKVEACCNRNKRILMQKPRVVSVGCGYKVTGGKTTDEYCIVVGVTHKMHNISLKSKNLIPAMIENVLTDVVQVGTIVAQFDPTLKQRPAPPGVSIGHSAITAGTFGCVVRKDGERFILSNNHVLAFSNEGVSGDNILQPGAADGGVLAGDVLAVLSDFVKIEFNDGGGLPTCPITGAYAGLYNLFAKLFNRVHRVKAINPDVFASPNKVDAALAEPLRDGDICDDIVDIGVPMGTISGAVGLAVKKYGRTTRLTKGTIQQVNAMVQVSYGAGKIAIFDEQIITSAMSAGGDSGSVVLEDAAGTPRLIGLLFAGSEQVTILNEINNVFSALGVGL